MMAAFVDQPLLSFFLDKLAKRTSTYQILDQGGAIVTNPHVC
jgi:hypothetical protein